MVNFFNWFSTYSAASPYLAWWLALVVVCVAGGLAKALLYVANRVLRTINVLARGWPPAHLDADGDWQPRPKKAD